MKKLLDIQHVLLALIHGDKIKRKDWPEGQFLILKNYKVYNEYDQVVVCNLGFGDDWELFND